MAVFNIRLAALLISLSVVLSAASANTELPSPPSLDELSSYFSGLKEHFRFLQESSFARRQSMRPRT
ncbi:UNVERIFIED_CONTAM: hypothetical protein Sradi_5481100 [Sesamum radiatum]|uniref:Neuropeptide F n=1 Tax=Sesamum radiatum TaxID=300843 RepID=A0AAW2LBP7_SESRA